MAITVGITHHTEYKYDKPISMSPHVFRLKPAAHSRTQIKSHALKIKPDNHFINWQQDPFGNYLARVVFPDKTDFFSFTVDVVAEMTAINPFDFFLEEDAETLPFTYDSQLAHDLLPYLEKEAPCAEFIDLLETLKFKSEPRTVDFLVKANQVVNQLVDYCIRLEPGVQTCEQTLTKKSGSCRDSAWLLVQLFRHLGLAARFVSGYLVQLTPDEKSLDGPSGPEQDFTDLHAWTEVYIPGAGWIGLDPTSGLFASEGHIPLACTPEPSSAAPVTGAIDECDSELSFYNKVTRIHETPRVTKPYSEQQWAEINQLGIQVDKLLEKTDARLTMGGEPTFISIDDMESAQWNTAADGEDKRRIAQILFQRMCEQYSTGGLRHYGQGKWYPGEPLPRWQYASYWRNDGQPIWHNPDNFADINTHYNYSDQQLTDFTNQLSQQLGLNPTCVTPLYEDVLYHLWQEGNLPVDASPDAPDLLHAMSRKAFLQKLEKGLDAVVGYVIPLDWDNVNQAWQSCKWQFNRSHCFLIPGDSPVGYRLPLDSLGGADPFLERDPFSIPQTFAETGDYTDKQQGYVGTQLIKTALTLEIRYGRLYVFMPPLNAMEQYIALCHAIETIAERLAIKVVLEGYTPPHDSRVNKFAVTPDPGVIEVNIHPSSNWPELVERTTELYQLAKECRLGTDKFMLDGRHTGTGGGNHVTMGSYRPEFSPFLRKPDVLRSFITYWQHHPGLSYLFSGLFIGPTSQAPRVDEARNESLYELEIAFSKMPTGEVQQPWLVDRLLRNLLVDLTGNTHRAEFCIDKLYSPDSATGRLGIVEFRGFEMPPHARMSLMQMLLLRTLFAWFWQQPYHKPLVRWGTELHDKFLLPHHVWADIQAVCRDLQSAGFAFNAEWFAPFMEFRFPVIGERKIEDINLELRTAIEPWHVLGEEASSSGTARFVDSSLERVQIKLSNMVGNRYVLACNGRRVPLKETATKGEYVSGIRYRAWQPPSALHPNIGIHAPLTFDIYDTWSGRSIGGFTYHVSHPGGRNFDTYPINALEAEGRRLARFWEQDHSPATINVGVDTWSHAQTKRNFSQHDAISDFVVPPEEDINSDYPNTLDLRREPKFR
ncbi:IMP dehydrogenase [Saccharobesus litoralis]|uniref:IMP dehydrogenase n=1 Tax=Saccharobesus litoralis TaxID=2172099 RepID=A0A2S0VX43_9ALTE|nr:transglutaminase family protein [Saccharobesus litoralis]AWB68789.1 IMP dehydrogenase [Saccharobesus litoralis]